jgi:hypothetical protein
MAINVKGPRIHDPFAIEITWLENKPFVPPAKDGSFTLAVNEYQ